MLGTAHEIFDIGVLVACSMQHQRTGDKILCSVFQRLLLQQRLTSRRPAWSSTSVNGAQLAENIVRSLYGQLSLSLQAMEGEEGHIARALSGQRMPELTLQASNARNYTYFDASINLRSPIG